MKNWVAQNAWKVVTSSASEEMKGRLFTLGRVPRRIVARILLVIRQRIVIGIVLIHTLIECMLTMYVRTKLRRVVRSSSFQLNKKTKGLRLISDRWRRGRAAYTSSRPSAVHQPLSLAAATNTSSTYNILNSIKKTYKRIIGTPTMRLLEKGGHLLIHSRKLPPQEEEIQQGIKRFLRVRVLKIWSKLSVLTMSILGL